MRLFEFPRFPLLPGPTPLQRAERFERALGANSPRIHLKRDDLTGLAYGGNKARKLEFLVADALKQGATILVTEGAVQSNHARMTAAAAVLAGLKCLLVLDTRHGTEVQGNLLLDHMLGAEVRFVADGAARRATMNGIDAELRAQGEVPYVITTGGSMPMGSLGYVLGTFELLGQLAAIGESPEALYFATGSEGTLAGLAVGAGTFSAPWRTVGVSVSEPAADVRRVGDELAAGTLELMGGGRAADYEVLGEFVGQAYGIPTAAGMEAIRLLAKSEAVFLDPVYTGKAMSALVAHVRAGRWTPDQSVVFVHTGGGPSLFVHAGRLLQDA